MNPYKIKISRTDQFAALYVEYVPDFMFVRQKYDLVWSWTVKWCLSFDSRIMIGRFVS